MELPEKSNIRRACEASCSCEHQEDTETQPTVNGRMLSEQGLLQSVSSGLWADGRGRTATSNTERNSSALGHFFGDSSEDRQETAKMKKLQEETLEPRTPWSPILFLLRSRYVRDRFLAR